MSDLISRQAVLTLFEKRFLELQIAKRLPENKVQEYEQGGVNWCINTVRDIPSVENKGEPEDAFAEEAEETKEMTNEEMLNKVLRNFFPRALFIREINEASHTKKIIFSDEWLIKPYRGGE